MTALELFELTFAISIELVLRECAGRL